LPVKSDEVLALVRAHLDGDHERFRAVILAMAANADVSSPRLARSLRGLADRRPVAAKFVELPSQVQALLADTRTEATIADMVLEQQTRESLERLLLEQESRERLSKHNLSPARKLLFVGSPGTGKTMAASAIANALVLPMLRVQLHGVIASHLGETASHLAKVFQNIRALRAVYLFDEFDALSPDRGSSGHDVSEMRRVVNSLLQFVEDDRSESIIVAATNHVEMIDRAMFRRFDEVVEFPRPSPDLAAHLVQSKLLWPECLDWAAIRRAVVGCGHADLVAACHKVNKDAVLSSSRSIRTEDLVAAIEARILGSDERLLEAARTRRAAACLGRAEASA
jgi:SpoVK/Ycf46/Vps4 family AAA+-type ATPase